MKFKFFSRFSKLCNSFSNRLLSWVLRISNYKLPMPSYRESKVKDKDFLGKLARHPAYKDLCQWVVAHRDRAVRRLLSSNSDEREELIGQINAYEQIYNELVRELARVKNSEE